MAVSQLQAGSQSVIALLLAASPLYFFSIQARSRLGLDNLHLGLLQVVLLLLIGHLSSFVPTGLFTKRSKAKEAALVAVSSSSSPVADAEQTKSKVAGRAPTPKRRRRSAPQPKSKTDDRFPGPLLDGVVAKFLSCTSPDYLKLLPSSASSDPPAPAAPLASWKSLHEMDDLQVKQHPSTSTLYAICARFPNVPLRNLYEVLTTIERRKEWDSMCSGSKTIQEVDVELPAVGGAKKDEEKVDGKVRRVKGNVVWIGMKGVALIKAKDMVLLSIAGCLPRLSPDEPLRIVCATTSNPHPEVPPRSDYNRMELGVSGFLIEEDGSGGSKITQVTDLSGLGSWVPNAVIRTVTTSMLPKSLTKLGQAAAATDLAKSSNYPLEGDDWMPPVLGEALEPSAPLTSAGGAAVDEDYSSDVDEEDSGSSTLADSDSDVGKGLTSSASSSRELHSLINQLRTVTARLNALENGSTASASKSWLPKVLGGGVEQGQLEAFGGSKVVALTALGGAAGAAVVMAAMKLYERRRR